jgi:hypothetical protein
VAEGTIDKAASSVLTKIIETNDYRCPYCLGDLEASGDMISCLECSQKFNSEKGILSFSAKSPVVSDRVFSPDDINLLHREVTDHGWKEGYSRFLSGIPAKKISHVSGVIRERQASWKFLMDLTGLNRVLVVDTTIGTVSESLAPHCDKVYCLHPDQLVLECIAQRLKGKNIGNVELVRSSGTIYLPFQSGFFDLMVFHNIEGLVPSILDHSGDVKHRFVGLMDEARRVNGIYGSLFVSLHNRLDINSIRKKFSGRQKSGHETACFTPRFVNKYFKGSGFSNIKKLYAYPSLENISEIVDPAMPAGEKDVFSLKEQIKDKVVKSEVLAPAFITVATQRPYTTFIERLVEDEMLGAEALKIERYIVDVIIVARIEKHQKCETGVVIRIPLNEQYYRLCMNNMDILTGLRQLGNQVCFKTPEPLKSGVYEGQEYFIEGMLNGIAIDTPSDAFHQCFPLAVNILTDFHITTRRPCKFGESEFHRLLAGPLDDLIEILHFQGFDMVKVDALEKYLNRELKGKEIPLVWQHGDFKFENLLINTQVPSVEGIIDWDLSDKEGWPLIDLLHLLASRRKILENKELIDVISNVVFPLKFNPMEEGMLYSYIRAVNVEQGLLPVMAVIYWLHHVTRRIKTVTRKSNKMWLRANVTEPLALIDSLYLNSE